MEMQNIISMNHGEGEFSYAVNSYTIPGKLFADKIKPMLENIIKNQLLNNVASQCKVLNVADLGCGVGPTPITFITTVMESVHKVCKDMKISGNEDQVREMQIYMSDLPSTDFNTIFRDVVKVQGPKGDGMPLCFVMGAAGSFCDRLFPSKCLHFVHTSSALHWLSQVPEGVRDKEGKAMNKGSLVASDTSSPEVVESYVAQFKQDLTSFLACRSQEVVTNGQMLLSYPGRSSIKPTQHILFTNLFQALACLAAKGVITEEKLDSFDLPVYFASKEEVERIIQEEGSFVIENMSAAIEGAASQIEDTQLRAEALAKFLRSTTEALISYHFGAHVWDVLLSVVQQVIFKYLDSNNNDPMCTPVLVILLTRKSD